MISSGVRSLIAPFDNPAISSSSRALAGDAEPDRPPEPDPLLEPPPDPDPPPEPEPELVVGLGLGLSVGVGVGVDCSDPATV